MKENTAIQDYLNFKKEHNIQKSIREAIPYKENKFSKWIAIISLIYSTLKDKFKEKKNEHQSMQDYVIIMKYILEKSKLIQNEKSDKDLIKKIFRQISGC